MQISVISYIFRITRERIRELTACLLLYIHNPSVFLDSKDLTQDCHYINLNWSICEQYWLRASWRRWVSSSGSSPAPPPPPDWSRLSNKEPATCLGACDVLWRVECVHRWFLYSSAFICHTGHTGVESLSIRPSCVARVLIFNPSFLYCIPAANQSACSVSLSLSPVWVYWSLLTLCSSCCAQQDLYGVRNNFHPKQPSPEVSDQKILKAVRIGPNIIRDTQKSGGCIIYFDLSVHINRYSFWLKRVPVR